ncbi:hypothetical protein HDA40_000847 [Hamadaea flava]|uniref:Uncharacterized protein n=1 Tax=Hamadaea flava TaxID=1742688 RepID=A0ABV8LT97_9ACTN|nr:hypothetical protein [Hamadaea flava]MCP2322340.1 hypothetical protein [Hamadaea flava]
MERVEHRQDKPGLGEVSYEQPPDGPLFLRRSIVATTALALAKAHVPAGAAEPCERCGQPSPCPTAIHAGEVVRLSMPRPAVPAVPVAAVPVATGSVAGVSAAQVLGLDSSGAPATRSMLGLLDEEL